jgi:hypothetical protein
VCAQTERVSATVVSAVYLQKVLTRYWRAGCRSQDRDE